MPLGITVIPLTHPQSRSIMTIRLRLACTNHPRVIIPLRRQPSLIDHTSLLFSHLVTVLATVPATVPAMVTKHGHLGGRQCRCPCPCRPRPRLIDRRRPHPRSTPVVVLLDIPSPQHHSRLIPPAPTNANTPQVPAMLRATAIRRDNNHRGPHRSACLVGCPAMAQPHRLVSPNSKQCHKPLPSVHPEEDTGALEEGPRRICNISNISNIRNIRDHIQSNPSLPLRRPTVSSLRPLVPHMYRVVL